MRAIDYCNKETLEKETSCIVDSSSQLSNEILTNNSYSLENRFNTGRWSDNENLRFIESLLIYGNNWRKIPKHIVTRSKTQSKSHAQKFLIKAKKNVDKEIAAQGTVSNENDLFNILLKNSKGRLDSSILEPQNMQNLLKVYLGFAKCSYDKIFNFVKADKKLINVSGGFLQTENGTVRVCKKNFKPFLIRKVQKSTKKNNTQTYSQAHEKTKHSRALKAESSFNRKINTNLEPPKKDSAAQKNVLLQSNPNYQFLQQVQQVDDTIKINLRNYSQNLCRYQAYTEVREQMMKKEMAYNLINTEVKMASPPLTPTTSQSTVASFFPSNSNYNDNNTKPQIFNNNPYIESLNLQYLNTNTLIGLANDYFIKNILCDKNERNLKVLNQEFDQIENINLINPFALDFDLNLNNGNGVNIENNLINYEGNYNNNNEEADDYFLNNNLPFTYYI